jgi:hypothetical protein
VLKLVAGGAVFPVGGRQNPPLNDKYYVHRQSRTYARGHVHTTSCFPNITPPPRITRSMHTSPQCTRCCRKACHTVQTYVHMQRAEGVCARDNRDPRKRKRQTTNDTRVSAPLSPLQNTTIRRELGALCTRVCPLVPQTMTSQC